MSATPTVVAAFVAVEEGMGQQIADSSLIAALQQRRDISVEAFPVSSLRTQAAVRRRLPLGPLDRAPYVVKRLAGAAAYPGRLVHRFDCRLPPAPREIVTVHDLAPLRFSDEGPWPRHVGEGLRRALAVVCPSEFSANELRTEYALTNVHVVPNGLDPAFLKPEPLDDTQLHQLGLRYRYVLHTGGATQRKNLAALAAAWPAVHHAFPDVDLVLCGPPDHRRTELFADLPATQMLGKVPREALVGLMAGAATVVIPSHYEGYGLPAAEAMACGVPVVAAERAALPEVVGGYGYLVESDADAIAEGLCRVLDGDHGLPLAAAKAKAHSWTWQARAAEYVSLYQRVSG